MSIPETRERLIKARIKADKLSAEIKDLKDTLIDHELSRDPAITSFMIVSKDGKVKISKGSDFEVFNRAANKRIPPYEGGRLEIYNHLSSEDQEFWNENTTIQEGSWNCRSVKK